MQIQAQPSSRILKGRMKHSRVSDPTQFPPLVTIIGSISALFRSSQFVILIDQVLIKIRRRQWLKNAWTTKTSLSMILHVSHSYRGTDTTQECEILSFVFIERDFKFHILLRSPQTVLAFLIRLWTSKLIFCQTNICISNRIAGCQLVLDSVRYARLFFLTSQINQRYKHIRIRFRFDQPTNENITYFVSLFVW